MQQDDYIFKLDGHLLSVGYEIGRKIAAIELHSFDDICFSLETLVLFDGDDTVITNLLHRVGDLATDFGLAVGCD